MSKRPMRIALAVAAVVFVVAPARADIPAAPANDAFADALEIPGVPFTDSIDLTLATPETDEPRCGVNVRTAWYRLAVTSETDVLLTTPSTLPTATTLAVFEGSELANLEPVSSCTGSTVETLLPGTTYYIQVAQQLWGTGTSTLTVTRTAGISGRVTNPEGDPLNNVCVDASLVSDDFSYAYGSAVTGADGRYHIRHLDPGNYQVSFWPCGESEYLGEFYDDHLFFEDADLVAVAAGATTENIDASLARAAIITGTLTDAGGPIASECILAYDAATDEVAGWGYVHTVVGGPQTGAYSVAVPGTGSYKIQFGCGYGSHLIEWYDDAPNISAATPVPTTEGEETTGIDAFLTKRVAPSNDNFAGATVVSSLPFDATNDLFAATVEEGEPAPCGVVQQRTSWHRFTAPQDGLVTMSVKHVTARLGVYVGDAVDKLSTLACNRDNTRGPSQISFNAVNGRTYWIQTGAIGAGPPAEISIDWAGDVTPLTLQAPTPCAAACPYWDQQLSAGQKYEATCAASPNSPEGSWADHTVTVPASVQIPGSTESGAPTHLAFTISPDVDHDIWICRSTPDAAGNRFVATGANLVSQTCADGVVTCAEQITIPVTPGETLVLRTYNWSDTNENPHATLGYKVSRS